VFTGLIEAIGEIRELQRSGDAGTVRIVAAFAGELAMGESVAVDGMCLTVTDKSQAEFTAQISGESFKRSTIGGKHIGESVNLERAMLATSRLGGHLVLGHVDGVGELTERTEQGETAVLRFRYPGADAALLVEKGSIAVDGISLTIAGLEGDTFTMAVIPTTLQGTTLGGMKPGRQVNLEYDVIGKYVVRALELQKGDITPEKLADWGY
jgi:riboflavin synthase